MFDPKKFTVSKPKPLPVYLLLDVSTTMGEVVDPENAIGTGKTFFKDGKYWEIVEGGISKMDQLNNAVQKMVETFKNEEKMEVEITVSVITFGDNAQLFLKPTNASQVEWKNLEADGETALGTALKMAKAMIEDKDTTPSRAYRPTVILVSDGHPNDSWEQPLENFIQSGRSSKCDRMAMAIGKDANKKILNRFIENTSHQLFYAKNATQLHEFFQMVTMSVTTRTRSQNPNKIPVSLEMNLADKATKNTNEDEDEGYW